MNVKTTLNTNMDDSELVTLMNINIHRENIEKYGQLLIDIFEPFYDDLIEYTLETMEFYSTDQIHTFCEEKYEEMFEHGVMCILKEQLKHLYILSWDTRVKELHGILHDEMFEYVCEYYMDCVYPIFNNHFIPKRSYRKNSIRCKPNIEIIKNKIKYLENVPQPEQRSEEWYIARHESISASSVGKVFGTQASINQLILEKCQEVKVFSNGNVNLKSPLHHGQKYEPVSTMIYEYINNTKIGEFGCIKSEEYEYIAASPDGINIKEDSPYYGRMLEIKNPVSRTITGIPKKDYWAQMQFQLYVCGLKECDFFETKFVEYENETEFINDGKTFLKTEDNCYKGIILRFMFDGIPIYEYKPVEMEKDEYEIWKSIQLKKHGEENFETEIFWKLENQSCILILRNDKWLNYAIEKVTEIWKIILKERVQGFEHRLPKKKSSPPLFDQIDECMIDINENGDITNKDINEDEKLKNQKLIDNMDNFQLKIRTKSFDDTLKDMNNDLNKLQVKGST